MGLVFYFQCLFTLEHYLKNCFKFILGLVFYTFSVYTWGFFKICFTFIVGLVFYTFSVFRRDELYALDTFSVYTWVQSEELLFIHCGLRTSHFQCLHLSIVWRIALYSFWTWYFMPSIFTLEKYSLKNSFTFSVGFVFRHFSVYTLTQFEEPLYIYCGLSISHFQCLYLRIISRFILHLLGAWYFILSVLSGGMNYMLLALSVFTLEYSLKNCFAFIVGLVFPTFSVCTWVQFEELFYIYCGLGISSLWLLVSKDLLLAALFFTGYLDREQLWYSHQILRISCHASWNAPHLCHLIRWDNIEEQMSCK